MANKEIGRIGQRRYGGTIYEEFLHELRGTRGIEVYREMSENDDVVGAILFAIEMLVRQCDWNVEPGGDTAKDKEAAEFVESCMHDMQDTWTDTISEILSFLTYGWSFHEIVYKRRMGNTKNPTTKSKYTDGLIGWKKLPIVGIAIIEAGYNDISGAESGKVAKGDQVDVQIKDIGYILAGGAIKKGEEVTATAGKATKAADGDYVIGVALSNAAENDYVRVQISKYQKNAAK